MLGNTATTCSALPAWQFFSIIVGGVGCGVGMVGAAVGARVHATGGASLSKCSHTEQDILPTDPWNLPTGQSMQRSVLLMYPDGTTTPVPSSTGSSPSHSDGGFSPNCICGTRVCVSERDDAAERCRTQQVGGNARACGKQRTFPGGQDI